MSAAAVSRLGLVDTYLVSVLFCSVLESMASCLSFFFSPVYLIVEPFTARRPATVF